jgi:Chaperone of endosialidase
VLQTKAAIMSVVGYFIPSVHIILSLRCGAQKRQNPSTMKTLTKIPITSLLIALALACIIGLVPKAQAVVPPPDGGYPNFTTAEGTQALQGLTTGAGNTGVGWRALFADTTGSFNTGLGAGALVLNQADSNTAVGAVALLLNTTGFQNTAVGTAALLNNTTGDGNTATGINALFSNTEGNFNTAIGGAALVNNTTGAGNTATGTLALNANTTGGANTATGFAALQNNTGTNNTAMGAGALDSNTGGGSNTAIGVSALGANIDGSFNTAIGRDALASNETGSLNIAIGASALAGNISGFGNIALGETSGILVTTANNVICIGASAVGENVSNTCFIGNIRGVTTQNSNAIPVLIDSVGQLGTMSSSARFKKEIKPLDSASEAILALKPVAFHYKSDKANTPQFGLIAEDVAKVNPDLVVRDENGEIYSVRYDAVNAMLLNEFLKEHRRNDEQQATITRLSKQIEALTVGLQKVSAQLEVNKPASQVAENNQ